MKITKTAKFKILNRTKSLIPTLDIYRDAISFYIDVVYKEWEAISPLDNNARIRLAEKLTHATAKNPSPKYNFDKDFHKFPSYLRRACIAESIGYVSSFYSNLAKYEQEKAKALSKGKKFHKKPPTLQQEHNSYPVLYKDNMFLRQSDKCVKIKAYINNDWVWVALELKTKNLLSSKKARFLNGIEQSPMLVQKGKKFFLHVPYALDVKLRDKNANSDIVIGIDLGITNTAVCSAVKPDGTVVGRLFINQPTEKDRLFTAINRLSKAKRRSGLITAPNYWRIINNLQKQITQDTANKIVAFARQYNASTIVFERLGRMKVDKNAYGAKRLRLKLQFWAKQATIAKTIQKAHDAGLRVARVLARGTSQYAFDGSGLVERKKDKKDLCEFTTGKKYHSDLNASYNIAARYFIKEILKPLPEMARLQLKAKVPELAQRRMQTLASLIRLQTALSLAA